MEGAVTVTAGEPKTPTTTMAAKTAVQQPQITAALTPRTN